MERNLVRSGEARKTERQKDGKTVSLKKFQIIQQLGIIIRNSFAAPSPERTLRCLAPVKRFTQRPHLASCKSSAASIGRHC